MLIAFPHVALGNGRFGSFTVPTDLKVMPGPSAQPPDEAMKVFRCSIRPRKSKRIMVHNRPSTKRTGYLFPASPTLFHDAELQSTGEDFRHSKHVAHIRQRKMEHV
ncbi:hypothetical protein GYMLUDRAFT_345403 [Collybiopsis luxurians FD-317 M1]|nr:hypothetical protein GYMLUDRAFT_345403 [Collybiopsis luxurians FD-317 M1]